MRALAAKLAPIAVLIAACAAPSPPTPTVAPSSLSPDQDAAGACDQALRSDMVAARNIRSSVDLTVTGIASTDETFTFSPSVGACTTWPPPM